MKQQSTLARGEGMNEWDLICEDCKCQDETVEKGFCPFSQEINYKDVEVCLCSSCYNERLMDI